MEYRSQIFEARDVRHFEMELKHHCFAGLKGNLGIEIPRKIQSYGKISSRMKISFSSYWQSLIFIFNPEL